MPPSLKLDPILDFNLYLIRAINSRTGEIIDLDRTNHVDDSGKFMTAKPSQNAKLQ